MSHPKNTPKKLTSGSIVARVILVIFILATVFLSASIPTSTTAGIWREASAHAFPLVGWHLENLPPRLVRLLDTDVPVSKSERLAILNRYFRIVSQVGSAESELDKEAALKNAPQATQAQQEVAQLHREEQALSSQVEAILESDITAALKAQGLAVHPFLRWRLVLPPVIFALQRSPELLVASRRTRIDRVEDVLLMPYMAVADKEKLEEDVLSRFDLSALVVDTGGIGTYPALVDNRSDLYYTYMVAAHEWTHNYLSLYPLGRAYFKGSEVIEINEDVADTVGYEIADDIYRSYGLEPPPRPQPRPQPGPPPEPGDRDSTVFDFNREMRQTRITVDQLLREGKVKEAESYMEERRQAFIQNGFYIRKLNQAYFAFNGTYASSPSAVSPVGGELRALRQSFPTLAGFMHAVQGISTYDGLLALLKQKSISQ